MALLAEIEAFGELDLGQKNIIDPYLVDMHYIGIPYSPTQWFGKTLPVAQRKAYSRAANRLEQAGLVVSIKEPNRSRVTHLRLTADGLHRVLYLVGANADLMAIAEGLQKTAWGMAASISPWVFIAHPLTVCHQ